jgi:hypothetical protein
VAGVDLICDLSAVIFGFPAFRGKEGSWIERLDCFLLFWDSHKEALVLHQAGIEEESVPMAVHERHHCVKDLNMEFLSQGEFIHFL